MEDNKDLNSILSKCANKLSKIGFDVYRSCSNYNDNKNIISAEFHIHVDKSSPKLVDGRKFRCHLKYKSKSTRNPIIIVYIKNAEGIDEDCDALYDELVKFYDEIDLFKN